MSERDNSLKQRVSQIIQKITTLDAEYVLDERYIRWGKVERDLWKIIDAASQQDQSTRPDKCSPESHALKRMGGYSICPVCDENISGG